MGIQDDPSLNTGKNIVLFMFIYVLGDCLNVYKNIYEKLKLWIVVSTYLLFNTILMTLYIIFHGTIISRAIWSLSYQYYGPLLIFNAVLLFIIFGKFNFKSKAINWFGVSVFAIYIIHHQNYILYSIIKPVSLWTHGLSESPIIVLFYLSVLTLAVLLICISIDKLFSPLWSSLTSFANKVDKKLSERLMF